MKSVLCGGPPARYLGWGGITVPRRERAVFAEARYLEIAGNNSAVPHHRCLLLAAHAMCCEGYPQAPARRVFNDPPASACG